ncbi:MAG TPA: FeoA family protein [Longimicrobiales bacterium]|jgi:Fe2+ transport system protein FeoA
MMLVRRIWDGLRRVGSSAWDDQCVSGAPVREVDWCDALACPTIRLHEAPEGSHTVLSCLEKPDSDAARKLAALGLLPGTKLHLVQKFPAYVVRLGYAELALDRELAGHVRVHVVG